MNQNYAHVFSSLFRGVLAEDGAAWGKGGSCHILIWFVKTWLKVNSCLRI